RHDTDMARTSRPYAVCDGLADGHRRARQGRRRGQHLAAEAGANQVIELDDRRTSRQTAGDGAVEVRPQAVGMHEVETWRRADDHPYRPRRGEDLEPELPDRRTTLGVRGA